MAQLAKELTANDPEGLLNVIIKAQDIQINLKSR